MSGSKTVRLDRDKFEEWCRSVGHTFTSLSTAYSTVGYISKRFTLYGGTFAPEFITWCNRMYPWGRQALLEAVMPDEPKAEEKPVR
jgi:hypothetical protein